MSDLLPSRDIDAARRRAERIRIKARTITEQYESLRDLLDEAERCEDHLALGYASWTAYLADLFGDEPLRLPRDERIPMSVMLTDAGVSTRAAGQILGVNHQTIVNDVRSGVENSTPATSGDVRPGEEISSPAPTPVAPTGTPERIDPLTGEVLDGCRPLPSPTPEQPGATTGLDGKTYPRPTPKPEAPRRRPLPDQMLDAFRDLGRRVESIERLVKDDRFTQNRDKAAARHHSDLVRIIDALQRVAADLGTPTQ